MIRSLNLDQLFIPTSIPEIEWKSKKFSGGESHITLNTLIDYSSVKKVVITHRIKSSDDLMLLLLAHNTLLNLGVRKFDLIIPYIPYARQDRICQPGEPLSIKVFANIINSINAERVIVMDAHSEVSTALINNCKNTPNTAIVSRYLSHINLNKFYLVSPDAGASKKIQVLYDELVQQGFTILGIIKCDKIRNLSTGKVDNVSVTNFNDLLGLPCVIVDDICSYGNTFIQAKKSLELTNAGDVHLFTTHFEGMVTNLGDYFDSVGFTNSFWTMPTPAPKNYIQFPLQF